MVGLLGMGLVVPSIIAGFVNRLETVRADHWSDKCQGNSSNIVMNKHRKESTKSVCFFGYQINTFQSIKMVIYEIF